MQSCGSRQLRFSAAPCCCTCASGGHVATPWWRSSKQLIVNLSLSTSSSLRHCSWWATNRMALMQRCPHHKFNLSRTHFVTGTRFEPSTHHASNTDTLMTRKHIVLDYCFSSHQLDCAAGCPQPNTCKYTRYTIRIIKYYCTRTYTGTFRNRFHGGDPATGSNSLSERTCDNVMCDLGIYKTTNGQAMITHSFFNLFV